jgi:hypothetical protein
MKLESQTVHIVKKYTKRLLLKPGKALKLPNQIPMMQSPLKLTERNSLSRYPPEVPKKRQRQTRPKRKTQKKQKKNQKKKQKLKRKRRRLLERRRG